MDIAHEAASEFFESSAESKQEFMYNHINAINTINMFYPAHRAGLLLVIKKEFNSKSKGKPN